MTTHATRLEPVALSAAVPIRCVCQTNIDLVDMDDPAIKVMTDLMQHKTITVAPGSTIGFALQLMIHGGVRMLLVTNSDDEVLGLVTARDIMGERPLYISTRERTPHDAIEVRQIMTSRHQFEPLDMRDVERARVRDVVDFLKRMGRQHALVVETHTSIRACYARGIFSATQVGRQLGITIDANSPAQSFAEFERLLADSPSLPA